MEFLWGTNILFQKFLSKPMLDLNNVSVKFQLDWPANNRINAGSLFSHFLGSLFSNFTKCWKIQWWLPRQPSFYISRMSRDLNNVSVKFQLDWPANNRINAGSLFSHFLGSLFSNFTKCWKIQWWLPRQPSFYSSRMSRDLNNVSVKFQLDWPANNRIIAGSLFSHFLGSLFSHFLGSLFSNFSKCWKIQWWLPRQPSFYISKMSRDLNNVSTKFQLDWPPNNRIIAGSLFSHFSGSLFSNFSKCWKIQV